MVHLWPEAPAEASDGVMPEKTAEALDAEVHWHDYGLLFWECNIQFNPFQHFVARWPVAVHFMVKMTY